MGKLKQTFRIRTRIALTAGAAVLVTVATALALVGPNGSAAAAPAAAATSSDADSSSASPSPSAGASGSSSAAASPRASASGPGSAAAPTSQPAAGSPSQSASASASAQDPADALADAVADTVADDAKHVSVAVEDVSSGTTAAYNVSDDYVTASIIKVDILATLLYQDQTQGTSLTSDQQTLATAMIENSDNDAALALYNEAGGADGISAANRHFGLTDTEVDNEAFGDTTTTVSDQIRLLSQVFSANSKLSAASRSYIQGLMAHVESDQRWGVSAAADDASSGASDYLLKNGWLPRSATNLWEINSIGEVEHGGHEYLVAVLSSDNASMSSGIDVVQKVAKQAVAALG